MKPAVPPAGRPSGRKRPEEAAPTFIKPAQETVARRILIMRGQKVMLDADLAEMYGIETRALNQAVKRNIERFPDDFMFQLSKAEKLEVITNCDHLAKLKFSPTLPNAIRQLMTTPSASSRPIGFTAKVGK